MDRKLQKIILRVIKENNGLAEWSVISNKATINYWGLNKTSSQVKTIINHQLYLLQEENKIIRKEQLPDIFYILTPLGHQEFDSYWKKTWRFILYDKHNLFVIISLVISIISLIIALYYRK